MWISLDDWVAMGRSVFSDSSSEDFLLGDLVEAWLMRKNTEGDWGWHRQGRAIVLSPLEQRRSEYSDNIIKSYPILIHGKIRWYGPSHLIRP